MQWHLYPEGKGEPPPLRVRSQNCCGLADLDPQVRTCRDQRRSSTIVPHAVQVISQNAIIEAAYNGLPEAGALRLAGLINPSST